MNGKNLTLTIVMPALNEEKNIGPAITDTLAAFDRFGISGDIIVINDGSTDGTGEQVRCSMQENPGRVKMLTHEKPGGIGGSFWHGVDEAAGETVCLMPGDNEADPSEILRYFGLMKDVDMVIPFVFNKETRSFFRRALSALYVLIVNSVFRLSLHYTNGTTIYRKVLLQELTKRSSGFFFQTDILTRLVRRGYLFAEVPYRLRRREGGGSKAVTLKALSGVVRGFTTLFADMYFKKNVAAPLAPESVSSGRYAQQG